MPGFGFWSGEGCDRVWSVRSRKWTDKGPRRLATARSRLGLRLSGLEDSECGHSLREGLWQDLGCDAERNCV
jgi:hypothetical protein